jgi:hypothetical protein
MAILLVTFSSSLIEPFVTWSSAEEATIWPQRAVAERIVIDTSQVLVVLHSPVRGPRIVRELKTQSKQPGARKPFRRGRYTIYTNGLLFGASGSGNIIFVKHNFAQALSVEIRQCPKRCTSLIGPIYESISPQEAVRSALKFNPPLPVQTSETK